MIHVARRLLENLRADRHHPPLERLESATDPERFVWGILPYAARSFSFCIALLPRRTARVLAVAYLYCRMLDTCEDLAVGVEAKERALRAFLARFERFAQDRAAPIDPPPTITATTTHDARDQVYLLLLREAERVDALFRTLPGVSQAIVLRLVQRMGEGMLWAVRTFADQAGVLTSDEQLARYCFAVLGNPMLFAEELQRCQMRLAPEVAPDRVALATAVGEAIQLANVARDLEKDAANGVYYLASVQAAAADGRAAAIAAARRRLLGWALAKGAAFRPFMAGIPSHVLSLARGAALLMGHFTLAFWQGTARRLGLEIVARGEQVTPARSIVPVIASVLSRRGFSAALQRLEASFAATAARLAELDAAS